jgi:hypothetical protein
MPASAQARPAALLTRKLRFHYRSCQLAPIGNLRLFATSALAPETSGHQGGDVYDPIYLTLEAMRIGPSSIKIGKAILCPLEELDRWDRKKPGCLPTFTIAAFRRGGIVMRGTSKVRKE